MSVAGSVGSRLRPRPSAQRRPALASIAWTPGHELDSEEWAVAGRRIGAVGRSIQWLLGDWICYGNAKFGERYARASKITGYDPQTLMNMVYVASRFPVSRRRENLSWSHHEAVAALDQAAQDEWLEAAGAHRWSVSDLRMMLRTQRKGAAFADSEDGEGSDPEGEEPGDGGIGTGDEAAEEGLSAEDSTMVEVKCPRCGLSIPVALP